MSTLKTLRKVIYALAVSVSVLFLSVIGSWALIPDEPLDPATLAALKTRTVPPGENLHFAIMGFKASPAQDPHQIGMRVQAEFAKWQANPDPAKAPFNMDTLFDAPGLKRPRNFVSPCRYESKRCLAEIESRADEMYAEYEKSAAWIARYRAFRTYPALSEITALSIHSPIPEWSGILYISDLVDARIAMDMAQPLRRKQALEELRAEITFYQGLGEKAEILVTLMMSTAALDRKFRLASELIERHPELVRDHAELVGSITRPLPPEWAQLRNVMRGEFRFTSSMHDDISKGHSAAADEMSPLVRLLETAWRLSAYRKNASLNEQARLYARIGEFYSQPAPTIVQDNDSFKRSLVDFNIWSPRVIYFNPIGKILINAGNIEWDGHSFRLIDLVGQSRLLDLQRRIIEANVGPDNVPRLISQHPALFDPYTNQPMHWDDVSGELRFAGRGSRATKVGGLSARIPKPSRP